MSNKPLNEFRKISKSIATIEEMLKEFSGGPLSYYLERIEGALELLFTKYAPFQVGDRVRLIKTPEITREESWGWLGYKHFLVEGAQGIVEEVDCSAKGFNAYIKWDNESWIDFKGVKHLTPEEDKRLFSFHESYLKRDE